MQYVAIIDGAERHIEVVELTGQRYRITLDGRDYEVDARDVSETTLSLLLDDHAYNVEMELAPTGVERALVRNRVVAAEILDLRRVRLRHVEEQTGTAAGPVEVKAPMPGRVVDILVAQGDEVAEGQGLVVVEAMKMENELRAPKAGTVRELSVEKGESVDAGARLCLVE